MVQVKAEPIKETIDHLRDALAWLGEPVVKQKKHNNTLVFKVQPTDMGAGEIHLKVEINCKEHFSVYPMVRGLAPVIGGTDEPPRWHPLPGYSETPRWYKPR